MRYIPGTDRVYERLVVDPGEMVDMRQSLPVGFWDKTISDAIKRARVNGDDVDEARDNAVRGMLDNWRRGETRKEEEQGNKDEGPGGASAE